MASVQFRSAAEALAAFEQQDCEAWSLWQGRQFMFKGIGSEELSAFIDLIDKSEISNAAYTIAYYEDITDKKKINNKTPIDGSFNFVIRAQGDELLKYRSRVGEVSNLVESKISALENKFDRLLETIESGHGADEPENKLGVIGEILGHPAIAPVVPALMAAIVEKIISPKPAAVLPANQPLRAVSGVPAVQQNTTMQDLQNEAALKSAIERLKLFDNKLAMHLSKLADLAESDVNSFNYILSMFEKIGA